MKPLLLMGCSQAKREQISVPVPFIELYNGPIWQQVRAHYPADHVAVLSAEHGVLAPGALIAPYDRTMTEDRLVELLNSEQERAKLTALVERFDKVVVFGGELYRLFTLGFVSLNLHLIDKIHFAGGTYLRQRGAMTEYLKRSKGNE